MNENEMPYIVTDNSGSWTGRGWRLTGPTGFVVYRDSQEREAREQCKALNAAYAQGRASAAPKEGEVERLRAECDRRRRELSRERRLMYGVQRLLDEHCRYMEENRELDNAARSALSPASEGGGA